MAYPRHVDGFANAAGTSRIGQRGGLLNGHAFLFLLLRRCLSSTGVLWCTAVSPPWYGLSGVQAYGKTVPGGFQAGAVHLLFLRTSG